MLTAHGEWTSCRWTLILIRRHVNVHYLENVNTPLIRFDILLYRSRARAVYLSPLVFVSDGCGRFVWRQLDNVTLKRCECRPALEPLKSTENIQANNDRAVLLRTR
ncbi:unnamed protein product [Danaus chrysippus]|uniref:(African queen) hypothetical protein n=1 Tax=Danaus chrysippus TaxID=151541 RepID=A0A8J2R3X0_9NEOP|nr:unnamed protein product [Danaus chrysippus]